ncbi:hypothetical protein DPMN_007827 [Dreissena polymorpha]|uniref:Uncharacterized protein n=1 Tax=Dreissena polymorpha TaxID=45954 RepID=A0A9D4RWR8_DREPO|nr:hypothetical protein DPMN_007827 [Dreissena polymorpha]
MFGKSCDEPFKRSNKVVTLSESNSVKIAGEAVEIDPQLLFQRLTTVADRYVEDISDVFKYELSTVPSSLFDNAGLPRAAHKSNLCDAIWKLGDCGENLKKV